MNTQITTNDQRSIRYYNCCPINDENFIGLNSCKQQQLLNTSTLHDSNATTENVLIQSLQSL